MSKLAQENQYSTQSCRYFLEKKSRFCRLDKMKGKDLCVQHVHLISGEETNRIACPLDPSHTCDKASLKKHLKNCNATKLIPTEPWYVLGINSEKVSVGFDTVNSLKDVSADECLDLIERLKKVAIPLPKHCAEPSMHPALNKEIQEFEGSEKATKKLVQNSGLLAVMDKNNILLTQPACYVEFGAGRGQLTTSVIKSVSESDLSSCGFILVDRGTNRRKLDAKHRQIGEGNIVRVRADIKDLCLKEIKLVKSLITLPLIGVSKHLCGAATDLALRCIVNTAPGPGFLGGVIALCCHHRCEWSEYCGKGYFTSLKFTPRDFSILSLMSSWAVCCFREKQTSLEPKGGNDANIKFDLSDAEKENVGALCKNIIDFGRSEFLKQNGFECELSEYVLKSVTLENVVLVFRNKDLVGA